MKLFDKLPENFFSPLSRKYRSIYAFSLLTLYDLLLVQKADIRKQDYVVALRNKGSELMALFSIAIDSQENGDVAVHNEDSDTENSIQFKSNYIIKELQNCGWFQIEKDAKTQVEKIYLPIYSIQMLELINKLASDTSFYLPLVHQTYSELKLEDDKEDDQMFRTLCNAKHNSEELELSVTTLKHSIKVFGTKLNQVTSPNEALRQHFDSFKNEIGDKIYHPMKTYDSLGLYTQPIIQILQKWQRDDRIIQKLVNQAKFDVNYQKKSFEDITKDVLKIIQNLIDTFSNLNKEFFSIDNDNADYTEAVQKKVNFLSFSDKTMKGKIDAIINHLAEKLRMSHSDNIDQLDMIDDVTDTICVNSQVFIDPYSLNMPHDRKTADTSELLPMDDYSDFITDDAIVEFMNREVSLYSDEAIKKYYLENFKDKKELTSDEFRLDDLNDLVLYIYGIVKAAFGNYYFDIEKLEDEILYKGYIMPKYKFIRKETLK